MSAPVLLRSRDVLTLPNYDYPLLKSIVYAFGCAMVGGKIFVYGGFTTARGSVDDFYELDLVSLKWTKLEFEFHLIARSLHCVILVGDQLYIYGGWQRGDMITFDFALEEFTVVDQAFDISLGRAESRWGISLQYYEKDNSLLLFGGAEAHSPLAVGVLQFSIDTGRWKILETHGRPPAARSRHSCCLVGDKMYIFGGKNSEGGSFHDLFVLKLGPKCHWQTIQRQLDARSGRFGATMSFLRDKLIICGGSETEGRAPRGILVWDLRDQTLKYGSEIVVYGGFSPRVLHQAITMNDEILILGGSPLDPLKPSPLQRANKISYV